MSMELKHIRPPTLEDVPQPAYAKHKRMLLAALSVVVLLGLGAVAAWQLGGQDGLVTPQRLDESSATTSTVDETPTESVKVQESVKEEPPVVATWWKGPADKAQHQLHTLNSAAVSRLGSQRRVYVLVAAVAGLLLLAVAASVTVAVVLTGGQEELLPVVTPEPKPDDPLPCPPPHPVEPKSFVEQLSAAFHELSVVNSVVWVLGFVFAVVALFFLMVDLRFKLAKGGAEAMHWTSWVFIAGTALSCVCVACASLTGGVFASLVMASGAPFVALIWITVLVLVYMACGFHKARQRHPTENAKSLTRAALLVTVTSLLMGCMGAMGGPLGALGAAIVACSLIPIILFGFKTSPAKVIKGDHQVAKGIIVVGIILLLGSVPVARFEPGFGFATFGTALVGASLIALSMLYHDFKNMRSDYIEYIDDFYHIEQENHSTSLDTTEL